MVVSSNEYKTTAFFLGCVRSYVAPDCDCLLLSLSLALFSGWCVCVLFLSVWSALSFKIFVVQVLVAILKQEWPHNWPTFISDICDASKVPVLICVVSCSAGLQTIQHPKHDVLHCLASKGKNGHHLDLDNES